MAAPAITASASDLAAVRDAIGFVSRRRPKDATDAQQRIADPTARKLVEWAILHSADNGADFPPFRPSSRANPNSPHRDVPAAEPNAAVGGARHLPPSVP
jgi:hypothetical protein